MSWSMGYTTTSHDDLRAHAEGYVKTLNDDKKAAQVHMVVEQAIAIAEAIGATAYAASLSGHAGEVPGPGDSVGIIVARIDEATP